MGAGVPDETLCWFCGEQAGLNYDKLYMTRPYYELPYRVSNSTIFMPMSEVTMEWRNKAHP